MIVTDAVAEYIQRSHPNSDPLLAEMEAHGARDGIPIVPPETGALLQVLALASGARRALEVGTAIGVSTVYIARGLADGGTIVSFEINPERHAAAHGYLDRAGLLQRADLRLQDAREGLASLVGEFDFAFVDGVKGQYGAYLDLIGPRLAPGAVIVVDNALWSGSVADPDNTSAEARAIRAFNERLLGDHDLVATLTPVGDGVLVAVKR